MNPFIEDVLNRIQDLLELSPPVSINSRFSFFFFFFVTNKACAYSSVCPNTEL